MYMTEHLIPAWVDETFIVSEFRDIASDGEPKFLPHTYGGVRRVVGYEDDLSETRCWTPTDQVVQVFSPVFRIEVECEEGECPDCEDGRVELLTTFAECSECMGSGKNLADAVEKTRDVICRMTLELVSETCVSPFGILPDWACGVLGNEPLESSARFLGCDFYDVGFLGGDEAIVFGDEKYGRLHLGDSIVEDGKLKTRMSVIMLDAGDAGRPFILFEGV